MKLTSSKKLNYLLGSINIFSYYDVINHLPRRYEDFNVSNETTLVDKQRIVLEGNIISIPRLARANKLEIVTFSFKSRNNNVYDVVAFNQPYLLKVLNLEDTFTLSGTYDYKRRKITLLKIKKGVIAIDERIKPIYQLPNGYENYQFQKLVVKSLNELKGKVYTNVPYTFINKYRLLDKEESFKLVHFPKCADDIRKGLRHLKYEEALMFSLKNKLIRDENKSLGKIKKEPIDISLLQPFLKTLPYVLTLDQEKAINEIILDMNEPSLMYRLLEGDVGSGKTLVALLALYMNNLRGDQGVLMAPTDSLAHQHYKNALELFKDTKLSIALLTGATSIEDKRYILSSLEDGTIDILIGTHSVFSKGVKYSRLGLAIIDEQHKFGVNQRTTLLDKGENVDLLMMSATPIPRSLALSIYGDLDVSTLKTFPFKSRSVTTKIYKSDSSMIFKAVDHALELNKNVYVVAPKILMDEEKYSVEKLYARYVLKYGNKVSLLHGKQTNEEKRQAIADFENGSKPILVSTSVIEVGIDVRNSALMIIYDASNFGLSSLHQLRGRIGRDGNKAMCILTLDEEDNEKRERLETLVNSNDGFEIAEYDLKFRGPGEFNGLKQSGLPNFGFLNVIDDFKIFQAARDDAKEILENKSKYEYVINRAKKEISYEPNNKKLRA